MGSVLLDGKTVVVVGAGPGGLTLARLLQREGVRVRVFERDAGPTARPQGGTLDLHADSGQLALQRAGLAGQFKAIARPEGQAFKKLDQHGAVVVDAPARPGDESRPEIDRGQLRDLLVASLAPGTVMWGYELASVSSLEGGRHRLTFKGGEDFTADMVVGADGIHSRVRPAVSSEAPFYTGVTLVESRFSHPEDQHAELSRMVGHGSLLATGGGKTAWVQRLGDGALLVYFGLTVPETWAREQDFNDPPGVREAVFSHYGDWSPQLLGLLRGSDNTFRPWPMYAFPPDQKWQTRPGITLLGDAAHVMPPFTGAGANLAMLDAVELTDALCTGGHAMLTDAVAAYERGMLARMAPEIKQALANQARSFGTH